VDGAQLACSRVSGPAGHSGPDAPRSVADARRFARFLLVGLGGTAIDFGLLALLESVGVPTLVANTLSFSAGAANNFVWNRIWTFPEARGKAWATQFAQFFSVSLVGLALNDAIVLALQTPLGALLHHPAQGYLPAKVVATGIAVIWNYVANRIWTFGQVGRGTEQEVDGHVV
jgi:putative flippase GtrA